MTPQSPWRQPIVWLMVVLVGATVIGCIIMLKVAGQSDSIDTTPDKVQRVGQMQQADLGPDARANARKLAAIMRVDNEHGYVEVLPVNGDFDRKAVLKLSLHHPLREAEDTSLELTPTATGWRSDTHLAVDHDWRLQLGPANGETWRLRGRLPAEQFAAQLRPAVGDVNTDSP